MYVAVWKVAMTMGPCQGVLSPLAGLGCPLSYIVVQTEFPTHRLLFYKWVLVNEDDQQSFQVCLSLSLSHCLYFHHTQRVCRFAKANPPHLWTWSHPCSSLSDLFCQRKQTYLYATSHFTKDIHIPILHFMTLFLERAIFPPCVYFYTLGH